jgi:hypothetical protein
MVHGLPFAFKDPQLREFFTECGGILNSHVFKDNMGRGKGYGLVCFESPEVGDPEGSKSLGWSYLHRVTWKGSHLRGVQGHLTGVEGQRGREAGMVPNIMPKISILTRLAFNSGGARQQQWADNWVCVGLC